MASSIFVGNSGSGRTALFNGISQSSRWKDIKQTSPNRHDVSIIWLDTKLDSNDQRTQLLLNQLNDRVELFDDAYHCEMHLRNNEETVLLILSGKCAEQCLRSLHSLSCVDSIIIFCASPMKYQYFLTSGYNKVLTCTADVSELIQRVHNWIDLKCQIHFYIWNQENDISKQITRQTAFFLANFLLPQTIESQAYGKRKQEMLDICYQYYAQRPKEHEYLREFELTYTSTEAIQWYTRESFVHKIVNRALRSFDHAKLRAIAFYIHDLRKQLYERRYNTSSENNLTVYHGLIMTQSDIDRIQATSTGSLISLNGFLSTSRKREIAISFATKKQISIGQPLHNVLLEINVGIDDSPIIFADIGSFSAYPEEDEILFDIGTVFSLQSVTFDEKNTVYSLKLTLATRENYRSIYALFKQAKLQFEDYRDDNDIQISFIGKLLSVNSQFDEQMKKQDDRWQKFSLFRAAFNSLWHSNQDRCKHLLEEHLPWLPTVLNYYYRNQHKLEKYDSFNKHENESSLARFEPVLYFCFDKAFLQQEREHLSSLFSNQYRRFITKHLTLAEVDENLGEFYYIFYISTELPSFMKENRRIQFYDLKSFANEKDPLFKVKSLQRLIGQLLHNLGMFYPEQVKSLPNNQEYPDISKRLLAKAAKCYELLANESERAIERYKSLK